MAESKTLKTAVTTEVKQAETTAQTGNVKTQDTSTAPSAKPSKDEPVDLPTGARSHPPA